MRYYHVGLEGSREVDIVDADDPETACWKAGWDPVHCVVVDITDNVNRLKQNGDMQDVGPAKRLHG